MPTTIEKLQTAFPDVKWQAEYSLAQQTYFKVGGPAEIYIELDDIDEITKVAKFCHDSHIRLTILGGASNVIVADEGISGLVLKLQNRNVEPMYDEQGHIIGLRAGAGTKMAAVVATMVQNGLTGLEYFLGVPGTLGGAVFNNAHYLSHLIGDNINRVLVLDPATGETRWLNQAECDFKYDHSRFQSSHEVILQVEFVLGLGDSETSKALIKEATEYRATTQPLGEPSSGCVFQNVPNTEHLRQLFPQFADRTHVPGGFLIDQAGLKGVREGDIEVSQKHAAFMVNKGQGTSADLKKLISKVKGSVKQQFGVDLQEEVFYLQ
jgi:UDP-N-acetylmuramate dehydrogenase